MSDTESTTHLRVTNESGFPLQIAVEHQVRATADQHGWEVRWVEHAWVNHEDGQQGFIDLVLQDRFKTTFLVLECKRVRDATWIFLRSDGSDKTRRHAKGWATHWLNETETKYFGWCDVAVDPPTCEALYCVTRGPGTTMLERIGGDLISATEALATEEKDLRHPTGTAIRLYFDVLVTTADLRVASFLPGDISLADGTLSSATFQPVPYLRLRKQMSTRQNVLTDRETFSLQEVAASREHTLFVVRADAIGEFLREFEVPEDSRALLRFN